MRDVLHEPDLTDADIDRLLGELALDGPHVPLLAMAGGRVIAASRSLLALFGVADLVGLTERLNRGDPGGRRLMQLALDMPTGGAPRLERLRFFFGHSAEPLTFLCRGIMRGGERLLAAAVLNARGAAIPAADAGPEPAPIQHPADAGPTGLIKPAPSQAPSADPAAAAAEADLHVIRTRLLERFPGGRVRFVWRSDASGRVTAWAPVFAEIVGPAADPTGRTLADIAAAWALDPEGRLLAAAQSGGSWTLAGLHWPVAGMPASVPVDLGAMPETAPGGHFAGFRGFGIAHCDRISAAPLRIDPATVALPAPSVEPTPDAAPGADDEPAPQPDGAMILPLRRAVPGGGAAPPRRLSSAEETAFKEIALLLAGAADEPLAPQPVDAPPVVEARAIENRDFRAVLDAQDAGLLVAQGEQPVFANRAFLESLASGRGVSGAASRQSKASSRAERLAATGAAVGCDR